MASVGGENCPLPGKQNQWCSPTASFLSRNVPGTAQETLIPKLPCISRLLF
jgi:hypothetical protein